MKLNIFKVAKADLPGLRKRLTDAKAEIVHSSNMSGWTAEFYFSQNAQPYIPDWIKLYSDILPQSSNYFARSFFAAYLLTKDESTYALSYGKAHFYLRSFCDFDFGIDIAKRIANEDDINQTSTRRFQGRRKRDIRSYAPNTQFDAESGESVDLIDARIVSAHQPSFGKVGRFGTSAHFVVDIARSEVPNLLGRIEDVLKSPERFVIPRTMMVTDDIEISRLDDLLLAQLRSDVGTTEFTQNSFDLYGVDFVFASTSASFELRGPFRNHQSYDSLTMRELKEYISQRNIADDKIFNMKVVSVDTDGTSRFDLLRNTIDFIADDKNVALVGGKWMRFNQDYLNYLDSYVRDIDVEEVEPELLTVIGTEGDFNSSEAVAAAGFISADKDFEVLKTASATPVEAWDLMRNNTVYAVKFGTAQKLGYVCDQAMAVLEILRNRAQAKEIPNFERYCLWFGYRTAGNEPLANISLSGSIILKQKIETWARKCRELDITPVIRISRRPAPS